MRKLWRPRVVLSVKHANTCIVKVNDMFPAMELPDLRRKRFSIQQNLGQQLTVVVFWNTQRLFSREQFRRMQKEVAEPWSLKGVNVIAINVGDDVATVDAFSKKVGAKFPVLLDTNAAAWKKVSKGSVPRMFLVDRQGKILWFDIEYSQGALRNLRNAIEYHLRQQTPPPSG